MRILLAIVHYWNPDGGGFHQSLRSNPQPRVDALQSQLLSLRRLGMKQSLLHMQDRAVYRTNNFFRHDIDIVIITNGHNHVLDLLHDSYKDCYTEIQTSPPDPKFLGFEAQKVLSEHLSFDYDLYGYIEDDLIIHDLSFFTNSHGSLRLWVKTLFFYRTDMNCFPYHIALLIVFTLMAPYVSRVETFDS